MKNTMENSNMIIPTLIMGIIAFILLIIGYSKGYQKHILGMKSALSMMIETLPPLFFAFIIAGMIRELLPQEMISQWIGKESGLRGILIGTIAGGLTPGGPYTSPPIATGFLHSGAGIGTMVAFLTGWSLWAISRIPMEIGIMGWKFTAIRLGCIFFFRPLPG